MRFVIYSLLFLLAAPALALSPPQIEEFSLENGLRVIVIEDHRIPAVSHNLLFHFGSADDPRGQSGLSHYMEHMLFQGTKTTDANHYSREVAALGGQTNAFTTYDYTGYWVNIAGEHLPKVMALEADRWQNLDPKDADFSREQQVILEERRSRIDNNPNALFAEQLDAALYLHHPYGRPIIGWPEEMAQLDKPAMMAFYRRYHHPANSVLVIAGDITAAKARALVEQYYGKIPAGAVKVEPRVVEPQQLAPRSIEMTHPQVRQPQWQKIWLVAGYGKEGAPEAPEGFNPVALMIADYLLGGSKSSRLYQALVEQGDGLATEASSSYNPFRKGPGEFSIAVTPEKAEDASKVANRVMQVLASLATTPPDAEELERAKTQLIASNMYLRDGLQPMAQVMSHLAMIGLPLDYYQQWQSAVEAVSAQDVSDSLQALLPNYAVTGLLKPASAPAADE